MLVEKTLAAYLEAVRKLLQTRNELSAKWIEELLEGDANYLQNCFEKKVHPAEAAFNVFITEEESDREPVHMPGSPERSMYCERLLLALHDRLGLRLMDRLIWENRSKPPGPFQYASKARTQLNVVYEPIYWLTNNPHAVKSNNRRVLLEHTEKHLKLIRQGGEKRSMVNSDGAYHIRPGAYGNETEGRIPRNILTFGHRCSAQLAYKRAARERGLPVHGAPMPLKLAEFLIQFLSEPEDLVVDTFAGSQTTADAAERLGRRWLTTEVMAEYVLGGATRFAQRPGFNLWLPA